ncbi:MAG: 2-amino-4-hydroxy-6-hydroxymethyldihydropteridine diphosphokinase [Rhodobacteraceae bacterium]|nr:2-amino-4-hydroxy-6-hydroxymethyldihydropteridine diphosphokinase [Paracoccaceae bacterium]
MTIGQTALVAFGGNLSHEGMPPKELILAALAEFEHENLPITRLSRLFETPCFPPGAGPNYVNAAATVTLRHNQTPAEVLAALHRMEARFGRVRQQRWGMRTLDIDLLAIGQTILPSREIFLHWRDLSASEQRSQVPQQLILPHPRLHERGFVLVPLADVAPDWRHPVLGQSVAEMLAALPMAERAEIIPIP